MFRFFVSYAGFFRRSERSVLWEVTMVVVYVKVVLP